jgi:calcineurin-like phosphoesterase family protein
MNLNHYFAADPHIGHRKVLIYDGRPWDDIETHDRDIKANLRPESYDKNRANELWLLGDVAGSKRQIEELMAEIRPHWHKIHLIRGNHDDKAAWKMRHLFDSANEALYLRISEEIQLYLSHYSHRVWRKSNHNAIHLHGHSHGNLSPWGRSVDTYIGLNNWKPFPLPKILKMVEGQPSIDHHQPMLPERLHTRITTTPTGELLTFQRNWIPVGQAVLSNGKYFLEHEGTALQLNSENECWAILLGCKPQAFEKQTPRK